MSTRLKYLQDMEQSDRTRSFFLFLTYAAGELEMWASLVQRLTPEAADFDNYLHAAVDDLSNAVQYLDRNVGLIHNVLDTRNKYR